MSTYIVILIFRFPDFFRSLYVSMKNSMNLGELLEVRPDPALGISYLLAAEGGKALAVGAGERSRAVCAPL